MSPTAAAVVDLARHPRSQPPGSVEQLAVDLIETRAENFRLEAENSGLREALRALRVDEDLARDLAAKAEAVRAECAKDLRAAITDSQRSVTDGAR